MICHPDKKKRKWKQRKTTSRRKKDSFGWNRLIFIYCEKHLSRRVLNLSTPRSENFHQRNDEKPKSERADKAMDVKKNKSTLKSASSASFCECQQITRCSNSPPKATQAISSLEATKAILKIAGISFQLLLVPQDNFRHSKSRRSKLKSEANTKILKMKSLKLQWRWWGRVILWLNNNNRKKTPGWDKIVDISHFLLPCDKFYWKNYSLKYLRKSVNFL